MATHLARLLTVFALIMCAGFATGQTPVFGPEIFTRETGAPTTVVSNFSVDTSNSEFTIVVQNGEGKRGKVSSAVIWINGSQIVGPNEFNKQVDVISKPVQLQSENTLSVQVRSAPGSSIRVTVLGPDRPARTGSLQANPDGFPVDTATVVTFNASVPYDPQGSAPVVVLERLLSGSVVDEGVMVDNGDLNQGDEIQGDGVFSFRNTYLSASPEDLTFRARVVIGSGTTHTDQATVTIFIPVSGQYAQAIDDAQLTAEQVYFASLPTKGHSQALLDTVTYLQGLAIVAAAGVSDGGFSVWAVYTNGFNGGIAFNPPGTRGGAPMLALKTSGYVSLATTPPPAGMAAAEEVKSTNVLILSPFQDEFLSTDDGSVVKQIFDDHNTAGECPEYDIVYLQNSQVGVGAYKAIGKYGIVHICSHGTMNQNRVVIFTKATNSLANLQTYQVDIQKGRLTTETINNRTWLAATPAFFSYYIKTMPSSFVFFASCNSTTNNGMADAIVAKGAKTFMGFDNVVPSNFAQGKATYFYDAWIDDPTALVTTGEIYNGGCAGGACWSMIGSSTLEAPSGALKDASFESGALGTWTASGDGRILSQLGSFAPTEGGRLALVSTGLGFTVSSGSLEQKVCIPSNATTLEFDWNYSSEEFLEYCGSIFQDFFSVDLIDSAGAATNVFYREVDMLCGSVFPVGFSFDVGDVHSTGWLHASIDVSSFATSNAGAPVTLRFSVGDVGDSVYDTAVLIDDVKVNTP